MNTKTITDYRFQTLTNNTKVYADMFFHTTDDIPHRHNDYYEILLITNGSVSHTIGDATTLLTEGNLLLCKPGSSHHLSATSAQSTYFSLCIEQRYFKKSAKQMFPAFDLNTIQNCFSKSIIPEKVTYMEQLGKSIVKRGKETQILADRFLFLALSDFLYYSETLDCNTYVSDIIQKLNNEIYFTMSVEELCADYPYSHSMLLRQFKDLTGMTIAEYKVKQKMKYACSLLAETDTKIVDIATSLHYNSLSYFFQTFKKHIGVTPSEYRRLH